ncbi:hypothetical protein FKM82_017041 [Ascaphus truei]
MLLLYSTLLWIRPFLLQVCPLELTDGLSGCLNVPYFWGAGEGGGWGLQQSWGGQWRQRAGAELTPAELGRARYVECASP